MTTPRRAEPPGKRAPETALDPGDGTIDHAKNNAVGFSKEELRIVEISPRYRTFVIFRKECKNFAFRMLSSRISTALTCARGNAAYNLRAGTSLIMTEITIQPVRARASR